MGRNGTQLKHEAKTRLDDELNEKLQAEAKRLERSEAFIIRRALRDYFAKDVAEAVA